MHSLVIRADATTQIGSGHIMRCLALAQAWQEKGGSVSFISYCDSESLRKRIRAEGFNLIPIENPHPDPSDLEQTLQVFKRHALCAVRSGPTWLVLDGYHFTPDYQKAIRDAGIRLLVIDDMNHLPHYHADIILNQNIHAPDLHYQCHEDTTLLLSTRYVLLRREFLKFRDFKRDFPDRTKKILVTMGGGDPDNVTLKVIEAIKQLNEPELEVQVVIGPSNPHAQELKNAMRHAPCSMLPVQNATNMPELMAWADVAISAGGSTCWEYLFMQLPASLITLAENQEPLAEKLHQMGLVLSMGRYETLSLAALKETIYRLIHDQALRAELIRSSRRTIDGLGPGRIIRELF